MLPCFPTTYLYLHCSPKVLLVFFFLFVQLYAECIKIFEITHESWKWNWELLLHFFLNLNDLNGILHRKQRCFTVSSFNHAQNKLADANTIFFSVKHVWLFCDQTKHVLVSCKHRNVRHKSDTRNLILQAIW